MNATDFIKKMMDKISSSIEGISIKYALEESTGFHIIEVSPESIRTGNEAYKKLAHQFRVDFHREFPMEDIIVSNVSELHDMSNLLYSNNTGMEYGNIISEKFGAEKTDEYVSKRFDYLYHSNPNEYSEYVLAA